MFFYRKDLFQQAGIDADSIKTMDEWNAALDKLQLPAGTYKASIRGGGLGILDELNGMVMNCWGKEPYLKDRFVYFDQDWKPRFTNDKIKKGFEEWAGLMKDSAPGVTSFDWYEATTQFAQGKAATFGPDASLFASIFVDPKQSTVDRQGRLQGAAGLLARRAADDHVVLGPGGAGGRSTNKDAAWLFIEWATSPWVTEQVSLQTLASPRASTWADPAYQAELAGRASARRWAISSPSPSPRSCI